MTERTEYYPYGSVAAAASNQDIGNHYKFTGKEADVENNLQYFGSRYYDNRVGKFTAIDPVLLVLHDKYELKRLTGGDINYILLYPQRLNSYSYALSNPLVIKDIDGNFGEPFGRYVAGGQRQIASFFHNAASYTSNQGGLINGAVGLVFNVLGDTAGNIANIYDPDQKPGTRFLAVGLTALDVSVGGKEKVAAGSAEQGSKLLGKLIKSEIDLGSTRKEFLEPLYSTDLIGKSKALIDEAGAVIVKYRNSLGSDGALSRIVKSYDLKGNIIEVVHEVIDQAGKIIHGHLK